MIFPDHPSEGDQVTDQETTGRIWEYDGTKWVLVGALVSDVDFDAVYPIRNTIDLDDEGKTARVTYKFDMSELPRINPN